MELFYKNDVKYLSLNPGLKGNYQKHNLAGVMQAVEILNQSGWNISDYHLKQGIEKVVLLTGLKGRWQILQHNPLVICDTGHNEAGIKEVIAQISETPHQKLIVV